MWFAGAEEAVKTLVSDNCKKGQGMQNCLHSSQPTVLFTVKSQTIKPERRQTNALLQYALVTSPHADI